MESLFAQGDKGIVLECYRTMQFLSSLEPYLNKKTTKKIQKDVNRESVGLSPISHESVYTTPFKSKTDSIEERWKKRKKVKFDICECNDEGIDENHKQKYTPKTWESITKLYGDDDTTQVWMDIKKGPVAIHKRKRPKVLLPDDVIVTNDDVNDNKNSRKNKYSKREKKQKTSDELELQAKWNSEYRDYNPYDTSLLNSLKNSRRNRKEKVENFKFEKNPNSKRTHQDYMDNDQKMNYYGSIKPTKIKCNRGPCLKAAKKEMRSFICRCDSNKTEADLVTNECKSATCKLSQSSLGFNSVVKMKDKLFSLCTKYSQKLVNVKSYNNQCQEGKCKEAAQGHKYNFRCKCDRKNVINECSEDICGKYTKININNNTHLRSFDERLSKNKLSHSKNGSTKLQILQTKSQQNIKTDDKIKEHESEQTGEPFFEVQVNPKDMCLLNPIEIKEYLKKYGKRGQYELKCICPSRGTLRKGELCSSGICKKAYKNRHTNFNCWCEKKIVECGDSTCDVQTLRNIRRKGKNSRYTHNLNHNKPLLEVQLDMDKMCVVNPKEIQEKMINNITDDICAYGICRDAAASKRKIPIYCKCVGKRMNLGLTECTEDICKNPNRKKRSKFCIFCTRICSKSENWSAQNTSGHVKRPRRSSVYEIGTNKYTGDHLTNRKIKEPTNKYENYYENGNGIVNKNNINNMRPLTEEITSPNAEKLNKDTVKKETVTCTCSHACECNINTIKSESKKYKDEEKARKKKLANKRRNKIISQRKFKKDSKRRAKLERKREKQAVKLRLKEIKLMRKKMQEEPLDKNFCSAFLLGILKIILRMIHRILSLAFTIIKDPIGSFWYVRDRIIDPQGTFNKVKKWFDDALLLKKLQIAETVRGSDTLTILADHFLDTEFYQSFADKGKTKKEQMEFENKSKARKRRIRKREQQAITSCRHMLLTTLRQTPCLWVYHICPNFYPQCLSLLAFMRNFNNILMFLAALLCWTPCIVSMELCRAILCCFFCTH